jgi:hypothetical protein
LKIRRRRGGRSGGEERRGEERRGEERRGDYQSNAGSNGKSWFQKFLALYL